MSSDLTPEEAGAVILGIECQRFLDSEVGKYVKLAFRADAMAALERLADVDLDDKNALNDIKMKAMLFVHMDRLINDAIEQGRAIDSTA